MTTYFTGGSLGTFLAGSCWQIWGWAGVAGIGTVLTLLSLLITICHKEQQHAYSLDNFSWKTQKEISNCFDFLHNYYIFVEYRFN